MKKINLIICSLIIGFFSMNSISAEDFVRVKLKYGNSSLDGNVSVNTEAVNGTKLDYSDDLDLDKTIGTPEFEVRLKLGVSSIVGSYWQGSFKGSATLTNSIDYAGVTYNADEKIESEINVEKYSLL